VTFLNTYCIGCGCRRDVHFTGVVVDDQTRHLIYEYRCDRGHVLLSSTRGLRQAGVVH